MPKKPYQSAHIGYTLFETEAFSHSLEVEVGHMRDKAYGVSIRMVPIFASYRGEFTFANPFFSYYEAGIGTAQINVSVANFSESGSGFAYQREAFGGLGFRLTESLNLFGGVNYIDVSVLKIRGETVGSGDECLIGGGLQFRF